MKSKRKTISRRHLRLVRKAEADYWRPSTRADCDEVPRPCPYVTCRFNLYLDMKKNGNVRMNFPNIDPHEMDESCALDVAERVALSGRGATLQEIGNALGVVREMARQMEERLLEHLPIHLEKLVREYGAASFDDLVLDDEEERTPLGRPNKPKPWEPDVCAAE